MREKGIVWAIAVALFVLPRAAGATAGELIVMVIAAGVVSAVIVAVVSRWMSDC